MKAKSPEHQPILQILPRACSDIESFCQNLHQSAHINLDYPKTFHNFLHVTTVVNSSTSLIEAAIKRNDPLNLRVDLDTFNLRHQTNFALEDLLHISKIAFYVHDTGNIYQVENGQIDCLPQYTAKGAETRSQDIAQFLVNKNSYLNQLTPTDSKAVSVLINYLISSTTYEASDKDQPFATFVRVCDQIGNGFFQNDQQHLDSQLGLIYENKAETPSWQFDPEKVINFPHHRFKELVPSEEVRLQIKSIWNQPEPTLYTSDEAKELLSNPPDQP